MRLKCHARGKFYTIQCPEGTEFVRRTGSEDDLIVSLDGKAVRIPADPPELLPMRTETGDLGVRLIVGPEPDVRLAGAVCPGCGEADVAWLQLADGSGAVHCDRCGDDFSVPVRAVPAVSATHRTGG